MKPIKSYRIWFTQRSGSTLLCKALESSDIAGKPGEFFTLMGEEKSLCEKHKVSTYEALKQTLWKLGTTSNGVFGLKYAMHNARYLKLFNEVLQLQGYTGTSHEEVWKDIFPNCKHIFLTRRNKVRQIVSWWKAIQDQIWHLEHDKHHRNDETFYEERYDVAALTHLFKENVLMECAMQEYFSQYNIIPFVVVYEDFVSDYEKTIKNIISFLEINETKLNVGKPFYSKTSDEDSEKWVERFRKDIQSTFGEIVY